jgi:hypothetical protein
VLWLSMVTLKLSSSKEAAFNSVIGGTGRGDDSRMTPLCGRPLLALSMARKYSSPTSSVIGNILSALIRASRPSLLAPLE